MLVLDLETSGLDPTVDFITMVGLMDNDGIRIFSAPANEFRSNPYAAEKKLLQNVSTAVFKPDTVVTFNGISYDFPFLSTRFLANELVKPEFFVKSFRHIDLMQYATYLNGGIRISKDMAASKFCGLYIPHQQSSGAFLAQIYTQRIVSDAQHVSTLDHNSRDLVTTFHMLDVWKKFPSFRAFYSAKYPDINEWL